MYMGGIGHYVHGYWPQRSGQSQSVNHSNSLTNIHFKSGGWPGFEPGSLTFMASALTSKLPTKLIEMSACLLTDGSRTFYQGLHCTCKYNNQLKFQQLLCTWVALGTNQLQPYQVQLILQIAHDYHSLISSMSTPSQHGETHYFYIHNYTQHIKPNCAADSSDVSHLKSLFCTLVCIL